MTGGAHTGGGPVDRAAAAAALGLRRPRPRGATARLVVWTRDPDPRVRAAALGALVRAAGRDVAGAAWRRAVADAELEVRRRAAELAPDLPARPSDRWLRLLLGDTDAGVAETAAWALGEIDWLEPARARVVAALARAAVEHADPLVRESAVAALGALGDARGLAAVLHACDDRPTIRRRAVLALAPFAGPEVDAALGRALDDPDWQVRQAAEDLASPTVPGSHTGE